MGPGGGGELILDFTSKQCHLNLVSQKSENKTGLLAKSVCANLFFFIAEISLWAYSCFMYNSKMLGNTDTHIPQQIKGNKALIRK